MDQTGSYGSIETIKNVSLTPWILTNDSSANDTDIVPYRLRPETYIVPVLFAIIFIIGVLGNGTLIVIFLKHRTMRNVPNMYIVSLAVGDLLVILFCVPFASTLYTMESWPYGPIVCKFSEFIKDLSIGVSVFTLTALSADRYVAIVDPMRKLTGRRANRITCFAIAAIWILSVIVAVPAAMFSFVKVINDNETDHTLEFCYPFPDELGEWYPKVMVVLKFLVHYVLPLVLITWFYVVMAYHLVLSTKNMPGEAQGQVKQIQARKKVAKMILSFVVIFAICFCPSHVFLLWFYFTPKSEYKYNDFWHALRIIGFCLGFINSCINPITLYCVSGTFRKQFNQHLFCCCCRGRVSRSNGSALGRPVPACGFVSMSQTAAPYNHPMQLGAVLNKHNRVPAGLQLVNNRASEIEMGHYIDSDGTRRAANRPVDSVRINNILGPLSPIAGSVSNNSSSGAGANVNGGNNGIPLTHISPKVQISSCHNSGPIILNSGSNNSSSPTVILSDQQDKAKVHNTPKLFFPEKAKLSQLESQDECTTTSFMNVNLTEITGDRE